MTTENKPGATGADLADLARRLLIEGPRRVQPTKRRIRVLFRKTFIVDTTDALLVWEHDRYPQYYVPLRALQNAAWDEVETVPLTSGDGEAVGAAVVRIRVRTPDGGLNPDGTERALRFADSAGVASKLAGHLRLEFASMDQWFEEDAPVYVHPKDPFTRIDTLPSSRPLEVKIKGQTVARTSSSVHLYETGLPTRYYIPLAAVDPAVLAKSDLETHCPYKGRAEYYHVVVGGETLENLVWYYRAPAHESAAIGGLVCFYNEKVDIWLDGEKL